MAEAPLRLRRIAYPVTALGPGRRLALWVAGCPLDCAGCISPELRDPAAGRVVPLSRVLERILAIGAGLDGISLTGGEPFAQAPALGGLLEALLRSRPEWNVLVYSGYTLTQLRRRGPAVRRLLDRSDILVAGPYVADRPPRHPLAGSGNQTVHFLSPRGAALRERCDRVPMGRANLGTDGSGRGLLIGILSPDARARCHTKLNLEREYAVHG